MKPKANYTAQPEKDCCQTPPYALAPLLPYLQSVETVWEPAAGEGYLVRALREHITHVHGTDILTAFDFLETQPPLEFDAIITNPPFSQKYKWIARCYELNKPWALLMPLETLGAQRAQRLFSERGMELLVLDKRVDFKMPRAGWGSGSAQFPVAWFTYGLGIGTDITYGKIDKQRSVEFV